MEKQLLPLESSSSENPWGKPESCRMCPLFLEPGPVKGLGNPEAEMLYLGEAPTGEEVDDPHFRPVRFKPFIGGAGRVRNQILESAGINYAQDMFSTNTVKCRPPNNRTPTPFEVACCAPFLIEEIENVNPNVIVAAGEVALNVLTDKKKIALWRGVPTQGAFGKKVFPTWHPKQIMGQQYNWPFAVHDMARAKAQGEFPEIRRVPFEIISSASVAAHGAALLADARRRGAATFDFETTGLSFERDSILMCGLVGRSDTSEVYDWTGSAQQLFQEILDDPSIKIIGQNILNFDLPFAEAKGHRIPWLRVFDTMTAFHLCNASYGQTSQAKEAAGKRAVGAEKDLAFIASNHTDIEYWKSRDDYKTDLRKVCGIDTIATDRAAMDPVNGLLAELERYEMTDLYWKHVLPVHPVLKKMTRAGVKIDEERAVRWGLMLQQNADRLEGEFRAFVGDPYLNLNSPKQLMELIYGKLKLPVQYKMDKKRGRVPTLDSEALDALVALAPQNKTIGFLSDIRHLRKMKSTYVDPVIESEDGHVHPKFGVSKAATGRTNSWDPNAQNVPETMRDIWIPDSEDHVLISSDWSQIEWRLAMVMSGDPVGLQLLASGVDNHRAVAAEALGKPISEVTDSERHAAKFIVYGLGYGRGAPSIAAGHDLELKFVEAFIKRFFNRFRTFSKWRESNLSFVKRNHYLRNPFMRRRWWYTWQVTEVYNFPQQSTAADMMYEALIDLDRELPHGATLRLTVHDEVVVNALKENVRDVISCIRENMQRKWDMIVEQSADPDAVWAAYPNGWHCPADIHVGTNWKMTKSKDPADKEPRKALEQKLGITDLIG